MKQLYLGDFKINEGIIIDNLQQINCSEIEVRRSLGLDYILNTTLDIKPAVRQVLLVDNEIFLVEKVTDNFDGTYDVEALPLNYILRDIIFKELVPEKYTFVDFYGTLDKLLEMITININWHFYNSKRSDYTINNMPIQVDDIFVIDNSVDVSMNIHRTFANMTLMEVIETLTNELQLKFIPQKITLNVQSGQTLKPQFKFKIIDIANYQPDTIINIDEVNMNSIEEDNFITANKIYVTGGQDGLQPLDYNYPASNILTPNYDAVVIGDTTNGEIEGKIQTNVNPRALYGYIIWHDTANDLVMIDGNINGTIPILDDETHDLVKISAGSISEGEIEEHEVFGYVKHFSNVSNIIELSGFSCPANETDRLSIFYFAFKTNKFISNLSVGVVNASDEADAIEYYNIPANVWVYLAVPYKVDFTKIKIGGLPSGADIYIADLTHAFSAVTYNEDLDAYSGWFNINNDTFNYEIYQLTPTFDIWRITEANYHTCEFIEDLDLSSELGVTRAYKFVSKIAIASDTTFTYDNTRQYAIVIWNNPVTYFMIKQAEGILTTFVEKLKPFIGQSIKNISLNLPAIDKYKNIDIGVGLQYKNDIFMITELSYNPINKTTYEIRNASTSLTNLSEVIKHIETLKGINYFTVNEIQQKNDSTAVIGKIDNSQIPTPQPQKKDVKVLPPEQPYNLVLNTVNENNISFIIASWNVSVLNESLSFEVAWSYDGFKWNYTITKETEIKFEVVGNKTVYVKVRTINFEGKKSNWSLVKSITSEKDGIPPATPVLIDNISLYASAIVKLQEPTEPDFSHFLVEIDGASYRADTTSIRIEMIPGETKTIQIKAVDLSGNESQPLSVDVSSKTLSEAEQSFADIQNDIQQINNDISEIETTLSLEPDDTAQYYAIKQNANEISTVVAKLSGNPDDPNQYSAIKQNANNINTIVATLGKSPDDATQYSAIKQNAQNISTIVTTLNGNPNDSNQYSAIKQNAQEISTVVADVNSIDSDLGNLASAANRWSSFQQLSDEINLRVVAKDENENIVATELSIQNGKIVVDANQFQVYGDAIVDGTLYGNKIAAKTITVDKLSISPSFSLPKGAIAYWTNSLIDDVNGITPEGYDEVNLAPSIILTPENAPEGSVVGDLLAGNKIYAGHEIQVGNSVFIKNVNNGGNEEGKIIVKDGATEIVKIGEKVLSNGGNGIKIKNGQIEIENNTGSRMYLSSEGIRQIYNISMVDQIDNSHSLEIPIYIPKNAYGSENTNGRARIIVKAEKFRAYSKGTADGGGIVKTTTSEIATEPWDMLTVETGAGIRTDSATTISTNSALVSGYTDTKGNHGHVLHWTSGSGEQKTDSGGDTYYDVYLTGMDNAGDHKHYFSDSHSHSIDVADINKHKHLLILYWSDLQHTHDVTITIPDHTHGLSYGIYESSVSTTVTIKHRQKATGTVTTLGSTTTDNQTDISNVSVEDGDTIIVSANNLARVQVYIFVEYMLKGDD